jgi:hypothetical protein
LARPAEARESHLELQGGLDLHVLHYFRTPRLSLGDEGPRPDGGQQIASMGPLTMGGATIDLGYALDDRVLFPIFGFGFDTALGQSPRVVSSVDGSIVEVRPWTAWMYDVGLPGVGFRFKERRWMFGFLARTGIAYLNVRGSVAVGTETHDVSPSTATFYVRAQGEACRRLDPVERLCFFVAPSIYEFGFGTGVSAGIRWEVGP